MRCPQVTRHDIEERKHLRCGCIGTHPCRVRLFAEWPWGLVPDAKPATVFEEPALMNVRAYLPWCFCVSPWELEPSVVWLQRQPLVLLDRVRLGPSCFAHLFAGSAIWCLTVNDWCRVGSTCTDFSVGLRSWKKLFSLAPINFVDRSLIETPPPVVFFWLLNVVRVREW